MTKGFTTYCLINDGSATPVLEKRLNNNFQDLSNNSLTEDSRVLLHSGFPGLSHESPTMLSPGLQLNGDLAGFDDKQLRLFAEAERIRKNQASFSSYTIDFDKRLCVISNNAQSLNTFLNTYGGVLDLVPLLIKGSHPDFSEVTEFDISYNKNSYRIEYSTRSPVDINKCTYCSLCGKVCPEACISETLYFDFEKCSFCRECEKVCPAEAIDIYTVEQNALDIPTILALGDTNVEVPEDSQNFYHEANLNEYLSTLFPCQVDEVISCNHSICQFSSRSKSGCDKCIQICPSGAISGEEQIVVDALKCIECGQCSGICPTGAIQYHRFEDTTFIEFFRTFPLKKKSVVVIGSAQELHKFWWHHHDSSFENHLFLEYPLSEAISALHLTFLLAHGASYVIVLKPDQTDAQLSQRIIDQVNRLLKGIFEASEKILISTAKDYPSLIAQTEDKSLLFENYNDLKYNNRRQKLSSIFDHALAQIEKPITLQYDDGSLFHSILCKEDACTQCLACLNECKIQALSADPSSLTLSWTGALCTGCGACVDVCPENALSTGKDISINPSYFQPAIAAQAEPMRCKECGKIFGTKKSFERVMTILAKKQQTVLEHLHYCEDCRVLRLLENQ